MTLDEIHEAVAHLLTDLDDALANISVAYDLLRQHHVWFMCCRAWVQNSSGGWACCLGCGEYAPLFEFDPKLVPPPKAKPPSEETSTILAG